MHNYIESSAAEIITTKVVNKFFKSHLECLSKLFIDDEFLLGGEAEKHDPATLLLAAYDAGLPIRMDIKENGDIYCCSCDQSEHFFKVSGNLLNMLEGYHNLQYSHNPAA